MTRLARIRSVILGLGLTLGLAPAAVGQSRAAPDVGDWVRLSTRALDVRPDWMVGSLATITDRFVVIEPIGAGPIAIPHYALTRVELQTGWRRHTRRGGLLGSLAGGLLSLGLMLITDCEPGCLAGPALGAGLGAMVGNGRSSLQWEPMTPAQLQRHHIALRVAWSVAGDRD